MTTRQASCNCGQLIVVCNNEPVRISMCHCLECQRRTGSLFGVQAWYSSADVAIKGAITAFTRTADSGAKITFHFCPTCGSTIYWKLNDLIAVAVGSFADPGFPLPDRSIWEERRHHWLDMIDKLPMEHAPGHPG